MVNNLNLILITSPELGDLRDKLKNLDSKVYFLKFKDCGEKHELFQLKQNKVTPRSSELFGLVKRDSLKLLTQALPLLYL